MYSIAGKLLSQTLTLFIKWLNKQVVRKNLPTNVVQWQVLITSILSVLLIMLIGCSITTRDYMEDWAFSSSFYFWFISLTTIGYGDLHFNRNRHLANIHLLLISASLLLFGLGMVAAVIEALACALERRTTDEEEEEKEDDDLYVDFEDHKRVLDLVVSTVSVGAGSLMESKLDTKSTSDFTDKETAAQINSNVNKDSRKSKKGRRHSFIAKALMLHHEIAEMPSDQGDRTTMMLHQIVEISPEEEKMHRDDITVVDTS